MLNYWCLSSWIKKYYFLDEMISFSKMMLFKKYVISRHVVWILLIKVDTSGIDEAIERCLSMGHVHSRNRPPRADRKESFATLPFCCERKIFEEFISGLFHGDPRGREGTSSVDFVEKGPGPPACRAYRASFLPLDWSAPSNWRSRKKKVKKKG